VAAKSLVIAAMILYLGDLIVFHIRQARGSGMGKIPVEQYLATPLKGSKAEYDYMGTEDESCGHALFPQYAGSSWNPPCWWLQHHNQRWQ
jgi:hypothetical protein